MAADRTCTVASIQAIWPCLDCLNTDELEGVLIYLLQEAMSKSHDVGDSVEDAACFTCMSDTQLFEAIVKVFLAAYADLDDIAAATAAVKCWKCAQPKQRRAVLVRLICQYVASVQGQ